VSDSPLICLVAPGHVSTTPRLVKNADALAAAGYHVHVVTGSPSPLNDDQDRTILARVTWSHASTRHRSGGGSFVRKVRRQLARAAARWKKSLPTPTAALGLDADADLLAALAAETPAQLFFGHALSGLPAAVAAARTRGVPAAFDIEDFHDAETAYALASPVERRLRRTLQERLLPACRLLTCASPLIGVEIQATYGIAPLVLNNVFPLSEAPPVPVMPLPVSEGRPAVLYWFSQTVGPGRGLEAIVEVAARMRLPVELHLRGQVAADYASFLQTRAVAAGLRRPLRFLPLAPPAQMVRLAMAADLGLALEESTPLSRDLCLTNKIFAYLMAGIPQLMTPTSAQRQLASELGDAALVCDLGQAESTARQLDELLSDPDRTSRARYTARTLAQDRFCWDHEKALLLDAVGRIVPHSA